MVLNPDLRRQPGISSFGLATLEDVRREMETVLNVDEGYRDGNAYMVLGLVDLKAPKKSHVARRPGHILLVTCCSSPSS